MSDTTTAAAGIVAAAAPLRNPSAEVIHAVVRATIDWFGVTIGGAHAPAPRLLRTALDLPAGPSRVIGVPGATTDPRTAALYNGTAAHALELDDIDSPGQYHPGAPTIAAALALGERLGVSGSEFVRAVAVGYEIGDRIAEAVNPAHYRFWHTTATVGCLGAAAAAATLYGLDDDATGHALALAATSAGGLQQTFRREATGKPLHAGRAAETGLFAAAAARAGMTGAPDVLEGASGFGAATSGEVDWSEAARPGGPPLILRTSVKPYPCCGQNFAVIDACLGLRAEGVRPEQIRRLEARVPSVSIELCGNPDPRTPFEARFSIPWTAAVALHRGAVGLADFTEQALADRRVRATAALVECAVDPDHEAAFPRRRGGTVVAHLDDGVRTAVVDHRSGDPANPVTDDGLEAKFRGLVTPHVGEQATADLLTALHGLPALGDIRSLPGTGW
jgi:2-methylcitrate dehydratase PrpD